MRKQVVDTSVGLATALPAEIAAFITRAYLLDHDRTRERRHSSMRERTEVFGFNEWQDYYPASPLAGTMV